MSLSVAFTPQWLELEKVTLLDIIMTFNIRRNGFIPDCICPSPVWASAIHIQAHTYTLKVICMIVNGIGLKKMFFLSVKISLELQSLHMDLNLFLCRLRMDLGIIYNSYFACDKAAFSTPPSVFLVLPFFYISFSQSL